MKKNQTRNRRQKTNTRLQEKSVVKSVAEDKNGRKGSNLIAWQHVLGNQTLQRYIAQVGAKNPSKDHDAFFSVQRSPETTSTKEPPITKNKLKDRVELRVAGELIVTVHHKPGKNAWIRARAIKGEAGAVNLIDIRIFKTADQTIEIQELPNAALEKKLKSDYRNWDIQIKIDEPRIDMPGLTVRECKEVCLPPHSRGRPPNPKKAREILEKMRTKWERGHIENLLRYAEKCMLSGKDEGFYNWAMEEAADIALEALKRKTASFDPKHAKEEILRALLKAMEDVMLLGDDETSIEAAMKKTTQWGEYQLTTAIDQYKKNPSKENFKLMVDKAATVLFFGGEAEEAIRLINEHSTPSTHSKGK